MDNTCFYKRKDFIKAFNNHKYILKFLPPYSPDLSSIEKNGLKLRLLEENIFVLSILYFLFFRHFYFF